MGNKDRRGAPQASSSRVPVTDGMTTVNVWFIPESNEPKLLRGAMDCEKLYFYSAFCAQYTGAQNPALGPRAILMNNDKVDFEAAKYLCEFIQASNVENPRSVNAKDIPNDDFTFVLEVYRAVYWFNMPNNLRGDMKDSVVHYMNESPLSFSEFAHLVEGTFGMARGWNLNADAMRSVAKWCLRGKTPQEMDKIEEYLKENKIFDRYMNIKGGIERDAKTNPKVLEEINDAPSH